MAIGELKDNVNRDGRHPIDITMNPKVYDLLLAGMKVAQKKRAVPTELASTSSSSGSTATTDHTPPRPDGRPNMETFTLLPVMRNAASKIRLWAAASDAIVEICAS